jgi:hypothetical protein
MPSRVRGGDFTMRRGLVALVVVSVACAPEGPIRWETEQRVSGAMAPGSTLVLDDAGPGCS